MARPSDPNDLRSTPDHGARLSTQRARQGQEVQGMLAVLIASLLLVGISYAVILAIEAKPPSVTEQGKAGSDAMAGAPATPANSMSNQANQANSIPTPTPAP